MPLPHFKNPGYSNQNTTIINQEQNEINLAKKVLELLEMDSDTFKTKDAWIVVYRELKLRMIID